MRNEKGQYIKGHKERTGSKHSKETKRKIGLKSIGRKGALGMHWNLSEKTKLKMRLNPNRSGERHYHWKGGITPEHKKIRMSLEYKLWREAVFKRDNYTCIWCGDNKGGNLEADHIKRFADYPELRFAIDNGRTLCKECHRKTDTWGNYKGRNY